MEQIGTKSNGIVVPLKIENKTIGALSVQSYTDGIIYDGQDVELLTFVAQHISTALTRARALEAERQRTDELAILNSVGEAMAKTLDVKTVTKIVGRKVQSIFGVEVVLINLYDSATKQIHRVYYYDRGAEDLADTTFPMGMGLTSKIILSGQPLLYGTEQEMDNDGALTVQPLRNLSGEDTQSFLGVPIAVNNKVIGVVIIQSYNQHAYDENSLRLLQTLASNMGVAIENARLFEAEQERVAELAIINSVQAALAAELDFQSIVDLVGDKLREVFATPNLNITWYDEKANLIHYLYIYEYGQRKTVDPQPPRTGGIFETLVKTRQPVVLNTVEALTKLNAITPLPGTAAPKSSIEVPIISSDRVLGDIGLEDFERENAFGESEVRLLTTIAASLGTALENACLFDETQRLLKETEQHNAELAIINSVQDALAAKLDLQGIYDLVGDKMRDIFKADTTLICFHDVENNLIVAPYYRDREMSGVISRPYGRGLAEIVIETGKPLLLNTRQEAEKAGFFEIASPGSDKDLNESTLFVPIFRDGKAIGATSVQSYKQSVYDQNALRLLTTLTNSMSVALENAAPVR